MTLTRRQALATCAACAALTEWPLAAKPAPLKLLLAETCPPGIDPNPYLVSEKLDGVRAFWSGKELLFRSGAAISAPAWFTAKLPPQPLDGELWLARGQFDLLSGMVRKAQPVDADWQRISYQVFELPNAVGSFASRAKAIEALVKQTQWSQLVAVPQFKLANNAALKSKLAEMTQAGGEGLMLHLADAPYLTGRNAALLKLKPQQDADAKVLAIETGKGKHTGRMGALLLQTEDGIRFKLGTGFTDEQRTNPPPVGAWVTYTYRDTTPSGKPRFASFVRVRELP